MNAKVLITLAAFACALTIARILLEPGLPHYRPAIRLLKRWTGATAFLAAFAQSQQPKVPPSLLPGALVAGSVGVAYAFWPWSLLLVALVAFIFFRARASRVRSSL